MTIKQERGNRGEDIAAAHLIKNKYKIIARNYRKPWGELDIIATAMDKTLVFVEVKTIQTNLTYKSNYFIAPEHNMTRDKIRKTERAAVAYANANPALAGKGWRIDVIAIEMEGKEVGDAYNLRHYENI